MSESEIKNDNDNKIINNDSNEKKEENNDNNLKNDIEDNSINFQNENEIKVNKLDDIKTLSDNKNDKNFIQKQKDFKELVLNQKGNKNLSMDQENLFETFVLFQNFINMNKMNNKDSFSINKLNFGDSKIDDTINENNNIKEEININESNINQNNKSNLNDTKIQENESEKNNFNSIYNNNNTSKKNLKNYDDIPIKTSNSNFLELLEKTLANEKNELNNYNSTPKKKIIKVNSEIKKRQIQLSKPSKKDKKYSYYTDFLDEKGHFIEEKFSKNTHPKSGRNKSSNSNKKHSFSENKNNLSDNISNIEIKINNKTSRPLHDIIFDNKLNYDENSDKKNDNNNNNIEVIVEKNEKKKIFTKEKIIEQKIWELNNELIKYKQERSKIDRLKNEYEQLQYELNLDIEEFNSKKIEFEKFRESELKKIEKEKKNYNIIKIQNQQLINNAKKDKETIDFLRKQISKLQNELRHKEINNKHALIKMKKQIK